MELPDIRFWAGTEESFNNYLAALKFASTLDVQAYYQDKQESSDPPPSRLLSTQGDVGVISISGSLVPGAPWYAEYAGVTGYGEIRQALVEAANNADIGAILLDVNSGGGAVAGVTDVADLISQIDASVKPVHTFSDSIIASAAMWIGAAARDVQIGKVAEAGSIGVLTVMKSMQGYYKQLGIDAEVLRSAEYKALGHPLDPITDKARAEVMDQLMQMDAMFNDYMASARGVTADYAREKFGKGRVFIGQKAVETGMVDAVSTFDAVVSAIQGAIDSEKQRSQYGANFSKGPAVKTALTEQQVAALAEGAGAVAGDKPAETQKEGTGGAQASGQEANHEVDEQEVSDTQAHKPSELVDYLQGQLSASQAQILELSTKVRDLTAAHESSVKVLAGMRSVVVASLERLNVALNLPTGSCAALDDNALLSAHASLREQFEKKFRAGGVAAVSAAGSAEKTESADPNQIRRIQSNRLR